MRRTVLAVVAALMVLPVCASELSTPLPRAEELQEKHTSVTGVVYVDQEDYFEDDFTRRVYSVEDAETGKVLTLDHDQAESLGLRTGDQVIVYGRFRGHDFLTDSITVIGPGIDFALFSDERDVGVFVVNFRDAEVICPDSAIERDMFTGDPSVAKLYRDMSAEQLVLNGDADENGLPDVFRVTINASYRDRCDWYGWAFAAEHEAESSGVDLGLYRHRLFVLPNSAACSWAGVANVGCATACRSWVRMCELPDIYAHELGHNYGWMHSSTDDDNDGRVDCEYCDTSDFMGYCRVGWRGVNGPHEGGEWFRSGQMSEVTPYGTETYVLSPLHKDRIDGSYVQVLKIPKLDTASNYYISFRQRAGYDFDLPSEFNRRVSVHTWTGGYRNTLLVKALYTWQTFVDPVNNIEITVLGQDGVSATVQVTAWIDQTRPDSIENLDVTVARKDQVTLLWSLSDDRESGLAGYHVYRDGELIATTTSTSYEDVTAMFKETYEYRVVAYDFAGNESFGPTERATIRGYGRCREGKKNKHCRD